MNIHPNFDAATPGPTRESQPLRPAGASPAGGAPGSGATTGGRAFSDDDTAIISPAGLSAAAASEVSDVRTEKVAHIQQALANGSYSVSPFEVAGKLIDHLLQR